MKLYYSPGMCSLSPHIIAREAGIDLTLEKVDAAKKVTASGQDYWAINPKGYVPALELDDGEVLTEGPVIAQYLADLKPASNLAAPNGTLARYRLQEMLGYINSEIHKAYTPLFHSKVAPELRQERLDTLLKRYRLVAKVLDSHPYLLGDTFSVADAYLFTITRWAKAVRLDLSELPSLAAFMERVAQRPAVHTALKEEGLVK